MFPIACKSGLTVSGARQHRAEATVLYRVLDGSSCTHTRSIEARTLTVSGARQHRAEATACGLLRTQLYREFLMARPVHTIDLYIEARTHTSQNSMAFESWSRAFTVRSGLGSIRLSYIYTCLGLWSRNACIPSSRSQLPEDQRRTRNRTDGHLNLVLI